jgi:hypothetical protein
MDIHVHAAQNKLSLPVASGLRPTGTSISDDTFPEEWISPLVGAEIPARTLSKVV